MAVKSSNKASSSKRTTAGSSAKASTTGPKPASPRTRVQKVQEAAAVAAQVNEDIIDPSTAMDVVPRYVRVPFGRVNRQNYQQARASAARKNDLPQVPVTPLPTAMNRPPLTMFDAPTKVVLPTVTRQPNRSSTLSDMDTPVVPNVSGAETDKGEETDPETPRQPAQELISGDVTDTESVDEGGNTGEDHAPSYLSFAAGLDGDVTDVEESVIPSSPTPAPRNVQQRTSTSLDTPSSPPRSSALDSTGDVSFVANEPKTFGGGYSSNTNIHQEPTPDVRNAERSEVSPPMVDPFSNSSPCPSTQWNFPQTFSTVHEQPFFLPTPFQPYTTAEPLTHTGTDFDLATKLNQLSVQATALPNNFGEFAQVHPDAAAAPIFHTEAFGAPAPAVQFCYESPIVLPPFASIWPQSLGLYYQDFIPLQRHTDIATHPQVQGFQPYTSSGPKLFQSIPVEFIRSRRDRPHPPSIRTKIHDEPQPEWQTRMKEISDKKSLELTQSLNPFHNMIGPHRWDYSGRKRGPLYVNKPGEDEPRKVCPLPDRIQTKRVPRPAKGSEEDLMERIEYERWSEAREARRTAKKADKQLECSRLLEDKTHCPEKKGVKLVRRSSKRDQRSSDGDASTSARPTKKRRASK
ncbi:hypothetical protein BDZ94DRAFT_1002330 [Collybia nuda]|uniref:Uncharacterized protein n=1 Tax=Collybia nuda TaxID=64659 RepID=A0A9P6CG64_9AGAR|nr:hypothetical protein BDZ94DRAFT_1002330 [Collybia nuda]